MMSFVNVAIPGRAFELGFRGKSCEVGEFCQQGVLAMGCLSGDESLFTCVDGELLTSCGVSCAAASVATGVSVLEGCSVAFRADSEEEVSCPEGPNQFVHMLLKMTPSPNYIYAVRVNGVFAQLRLTHLPEHRFCTDSSTVCTLENVQGTLLGFYFPTVFDQVAWSGYRFHFVSDDKSVAGRLIDCEIERPLLSIQHIDECRVAIPGTFDFQTTDF